MEGSPGLQSLLPGASGRRPCDSGTLLGSGAPGPAGLGNLWGPGAPRGAGQVGHCGRPTGTHSPWPVRLCRPQTTMPGMKRDCGGAAAILGAFRAAVKQVSGVPSCSPGGGGLPAFPRGPSNIRVPVGARPGPPEPPAVSRPLCLSASRPSIVSACVPRDQSPQHLPLRAPCECL